jgi:hypothetical protein
MKVSQKLFVAVLVLLAIVGLFIGNEAYRKSKQKKQWIEQVVADFYDPSAAQFRNLKQNYQALCGEVNGKNKMGAYVGFKRFYSGSTGARIEPDIPDHQDPESVEARFSASNSRVWQAIYDANCSQP